MDALSPGDGDQVLSLFAAVKKVAGSDKVLNTAMSFEMQCS